ncbi:hypothetical protein FB451DRAFT_1412657 [Mycena latifolia]|nr:hypothetical protein FB451DRAFT_1412657 [Mycena latifolia]
MYHIPSAVNNLHRGTLAAVVLSFWTAGLDGARADYDLPERHDLSCVVSSGDGHKFGLAVDAAGTFPDILCSSMRRIFGSRVRLGSAQRARVADGYGPDWAHLFILVAPAHYPCGPAVSEQNMEAAAGLGWASAVPDADATVELTIGRTKLAFAGLAYHDKNWTTSHSPRTLRRGTGDTGGSARTRPCLRHARAQRAERIYASAVAHGQIVAASSARGSIRNPIGLELAGAGPLEMNLIVASILVGNVFAEYRRAVATPSGCSWPGKAPAQEVLERRWTS